MSIETIKDKTKAESVIQSSRYLVLHFYADWVLQCQNMNDAITEMAKIPEYSGVKFVTLPAEEVPEISLQFNVAAVPTVVLLRDGQQIDRVEGANPGLLRDKLKIMAGSMSKPKKDINGKLNELINLSHVMLFMKGNKKEPRCGFSRQIVDILSKLNIEFQTFDILNDQEVREGLKAYSNWPTYPQLYIKGELIGGLDIVKEMVDSGELQSKVPQRVPLETRLKELVNDHPVMLFMKGNTETPKCGFSRQIVQLLQEEKADFKTFDILEDDEVRQGLKEFSNWPTYPQLYVKGQLIGGLDICKEMKQSGELKDVLF